MVLMMCVCYFWLYVVWLDLVLLHGFFYFGLGRLALFRFFGFAWLFWACLGLLGLLGSIGLAWVYWACFWPVGPPGVVWPCLGPLGLAGVAWASLGFCGLLRMSRIASPLLGSYASFRWSGHKFPS